MKNKIILMKVITVIMLIHVLSFNSIAQKTGTFTDYRNGKTYRTIKIGSQTWMAENLNYHTNCGSWCYDDITANCDKYGRLYNWETAHTVCPNGWILPSCMTAIELFRSLPYIEVTYLNTDSSLYYQPDISVFTNNLYSGLRAENGSYNLLGYATAFYCIEDEKYSQNRFLIGLFKESGQHNINTINKNSDIAAPVRCVKVN